MDEREQLKQAIIALEAQRSILGNEVVEVALGPMRRQLAELELAEHKPETAFEDERKQVTVMFADISGFTSLSEKLDPEIVRELVNSCFDRLLPIIEKYKGTVEKFIGDEIMAIFGAPVAHENDPERALRTALGMREELGAFNLDHNINISIRIGISTGLVVAGGIGSEGRLQYGVTGDTVNLAKRLQGLAPIGGVLISHATYRHVRQVFSVLPQKPIQVKGKTDPVQTYIVQQAKRRAFHMETRGVEGVETRMVGRDAELLILQNIYHDVMEDSETRVVTIVGEAGVGKSRLLYEFENWIQLLPEEIWFFKGWATEGLQTSSYGAIRSMFALRFEILESDTPATVRDKFRTGMATAIETDQADLAAHLIGFDLPASQALRTALENESFREHALACIVDYFQQVAHEPALIILEDMHWTDDRSLDLVDRLTRALPKAHLLVICLARPALFERRPSWGEGQDAHICLELKALSRRQSRALVTEILQKVDEIPEKLRDLVVEGAEGNPFYIEELIKMLIDDGVIREQEGSWQVALDQLAETSVPSTLAGVIQARLDSLPADERTILQRASVIGRQFWDAAVAELSADEIESLDKKDLYPLLDAVRGRELVYRREHSTFADTDEFIFNHALLRDVTYETVLLKLRRVYHRQVAGWLEAAAGERLGEYLGLIAGHYELAGDPVKASEYMLRAGDRARLDYAHQEAIEYYQRALSFLKTQGDPALAARTLMKLGLVYHTAFNYQRSRQAFEEGFTLWKQVKEIQSPVSLPSAPHAFKMARANPLTLDPTMADDSFSGGIINQLFSGLVEGRLAMETMPDTAQSWEISDGGRKYIFHLRDDVCWSDGVPLTADDFKYAWMRTLDPASGSPNASLLYDIKGARKFSEGETSDPESVGIRAADEHILVVELAEPTGYFLSLLAHYATFPIPRHVVEVYGKNWTEKSKIVTNGAFILKNWVQDQTMTLLRAPAYHGRFTGNLNRVEIYFDLKWSDQLEMYEAGDLDFLSFGGTMLERDRARRRHAGEYVSAPMLGTTYAGFNVSRPPFNDPRVRRAFAMATDKQTLADEVLRGYEFPAVGGFVPPGLPGHSAAIGPPFNPERAQELLAEAGYPGGQGFPTVDAWTWQGIKNRAEYLQAKWEEILGIKIEWDVMDFSQFIHRVDSEPVHMIQTAWMPDYPDPDSVLRASPIRRRAHWQNDTFERLVEKARRVLDQGKRLELYAQADRIMVEEDIVLIPLTYMWSHILVKPWVQKFPASAINEWLWKDFVIEAHEEPAVVNLEEEKDD